MIVTSFNLRGNRDPSPLSWADRAPLVMQTVQSINPDLIGFQEVQTTLDDDLIAGLTPKYEGFFSDRVPSEYDPEGIALFVNKERFRVLENASFMLSEEPGQHSATPAWDAAFARITQFVILEDLQDSSVFVFINTHFDHVGREARFRSANYLTKTIDEFKEQGLNTVLLGDFNAEPDDEETKALFEHPRMRNSYEFIEPKQRSHSRTSHRFTGETLGKPIDHIFVTKPFALAEVKIETTSYNGVYPSDHYPISAKILK